jgi:hypothetical protein
MAFGGYYGSDPVVDIEAFARLVRRGELRFAILSSAGRQREFERWVKAHGIVVDPGRWRSVPPYPRRSITLYELKLD